MSILHQTRLLCNIIEFQPFVVHCFSACTWCGSHSCHWRIPRLERGLWLLNCGLLEQSSVCCELSGDCRSGNLILLLSVELLPQKHFLALLVLRVVWARQSYLVPQYVVDANAPSPLDLLLCAFFVLLAHVHDSCCRWAIELLTVHALELLLDLARHSSVLSHLAICKPDRTLWRLWEYLSAPAELMLILERLSACSAYTLVLHAVHLLGCEHHLSMVWNTCTIASKVVLLFHVVKPLLVELVLLWIRAIVLIIVNYSGPRRWRRHKIDDLCLIHQSLLRLTHSLPTRRWGM